MGLTSEISMLLEYPSYRRLATRCRHLRLGYCTTQPATPLDISEYVGDLQRCLDIYRRTERHLLKRITELEHELAREQDITERLCEYVDEAAGPTSVLVPVALLERLMARLDALNHEL